ncbi:aminopeptidase [Aureibacillus halotolerans]|uniref:Aminopeptidase II n=1 Tax=Aureibacillus halotolerans TaxID=1508390 RepID=A0A4R6TZK0_9BACI|nr:aminopeptidase [Aureibacillus halotolerans]TDQ36224.1 aminopeptidase II [Aureibacillus halotolerans]
MYNHEKFIDNYADICVRKGVNIQPGQALVVNAPVESVDFVRLVAKKAYEAGAKDVHIRWTDDELTFLKMKHAPMEVLQTFEQWRSDEVVTKAKDGAAFLSIYATNPELLKDIDADRVAANNKTTAEGLMEFRKYVMSDQVAWSVVSVPTREWAKKVFPNEAGEWGAVDKLWKSILFTTRADQDNPVQAWEDHTATLYKARNYLNKKQYAKLVYSAPGTDLTIELVKNHVWMGGGRESASGTSFIPNIPTEEVFTMPKRDGVNGTVHSTKPFNYGGNLVEDFSLTFKDGQVVDYKAATGEDTLKLLLDMDEGARFLGEVALVPYSSPISQSDVIFFNTLYDENASCHLALGEAYPSNIENGTALSDEDKKAAGVNHSIVHEDFMIGSAELNIDGILEDGTSEPVFRNGDWAIRFDDQ